MADTLTPFNTFASFRVSRTLTGIVHQPAPAQYHTARAAATSTVERRISTDSVRAPGWRIAPSTTAPTHQLLIDGATAENQRRRWRKIKCRSFGIGEPSFVSTRHYGLLYPSVGTMATT
jgi:hypothetical protein